MTVLKNIVSFVGAVPGVPVVLPHFLNIHEIAVLPDLLLANNDDFTIGPVTTTTITVTNTGAANANLLVYVEAWHTIERDFIVDGTAFQGLTPQPFILEGSSGAGTGAPFVRTFNATTDWGVAAGGLYTITVTAVTHGKGAQPAAVQTFEDAGAGNFDQVQPDRLRETTTGDVSISVTDVPDGRYAGKLVIS